MEALKERAPIAGTIKEATMANGKTIKWTAMVHSNGQTEGPTWANTLLTRKKATGFSLGMTEESTKDCGTMENNMGSGHT